jgi:anthranilate phosphoribosyltransferase
MKPSGILPELTAIVDQRALTSEEIGAAAKALLDTAVADDTKAAFLRAWTQRGETAAELAACAEAFLPQALDPGVRGSWNGQPLLDCSGTGGGGLPLLNISTGLMFILAAMGVPVVKHGNRGLTKKSGSADALEALGIKIDLPPDQTTRCLEEVGCAFLFAPAYHLSFAAVGPARRHLAAEGQRTIFNLLGPLLNPARPDARMIGVFKEEHLDLYEAALREMKCPRYAVVCGKDRLTGKMIGEASANGETIIRMSPPLPTDKGRLIRLAAKAEFTGAADPIPADVLSVNSMLVSDSGESAHRIEAILRGEEQSFARDTLLYNASIAAWIAGTAQSREEAGLKCDEALSSGRAFAVLERWRAFSERSQ